MIVVCWVVVGLLSLVMLALLYYLVVGKIFFNIAFSQKTLKKRAKKKNLDELLKKYKIDLCWWQKQKTQRVEIISFDQAKLVGQYLDNHSNKTALIVHGYGQFYKEMAPFAKMFFDKNFNILAVESRGHGQSSGDVGFGFFDGKDVCLWAKFLKEKHQDDKVVLFGISMGATAVCAASGEDLPNNVVAIVEDSGYANAKEEISFNLKKFGIFKNLMTKHLLSFSKRVCQFDLEKADVCDAVKKTKVPILFIHGTADEIVPVENAQKLYNATDNGFREIYLVEGAMHVMSYAQEGVLYEKKICDFLKSRTRLYKD